MNNKLMSLDKLRENLDCDFDVILATKNYIEAKKKYYTTMFSEDPKKLEELKVLEESYKIKLSELAVDGNDDDANTPNLEDPYYIDYDFSKYTLNLPTWEELNTENIPYPIFLRDFILPKFHPMPNAELQYPVIAAAMLVNNAPLPPLSSQNSLEVGLPKFVVVGVSRSGKTQLVNHVKLHYPDNNTNTIKGSSTGYNATRLLHKTCYHSGSGRNTKFKPSMVNFDNVYWQEFVERLDIHYVSVLAVERNDAVTMIKDDTYYTYCSQWFTSIQDPVRSQSKMDEFINRAFFFYTKKSDAYIPTLAKSAYNWGSLKDHYLSLWNAKDVHNKFYPILSDIMQIPDNGTTIPVSHFFASRLILATGLYLNIWDNIEDAIDCLTQYWDYVDGKLGLGGDILYQVVSTYLEDYWYYPVHRMMRHKRMTKAQAEKENLIYLTNLMDHIETRTNGIYRASNKRTVDEVTEILLQHDLMLKQVNNQLMFIKKSVSDDLEPTL